MIQKKDLEKRLEELGWTMYRLAKQFAQVRAEGGDISPATRYHSSIGKAVENPGKSKLETIEDIVKALDGELTIVWEPDKVVTVRLDDALMEALNQKAKEIGTTAVEVAEQLLRQALQISSASEERQSQTGTRKLESLIASKREAQPLKFHPYIAEAYAAVHEWLATRPEAAEYKQLDYSEELERSLDQEDLKSTAFQYYALFPKHYFRTVYTLNNVIGQPKLLSWLKCNSRICIVDIGCAASAAFVEVILALQEIEILQDIEIFCLGVEPSIYGITLYSKLMQEIQSKVKSSGIKLEFQVLCESLPKATIPIIKYLQKTRARWDEQLPLSHVLLMQLDIISPFNQVQTAKREQYEKLKELGLDPEIIVGDNEAFGQDEALAYKQMFEEVPIDHLHLMTIGTENIESCLIKTSNSNSITEHIQGMMEVIRHSFSGTHRVDKEQKEENTIYVEYPVGSYGKDKLLTPELGFYAHFYTVTNANLNRDGDWKNVIDFQSLELAWAQARRNLLISESFYDEIEVRIFEKDLTKNLNFLREKLINYHHELVPTGDEINHHIPKGSSSSRPKVLSRLEEEILQAALVQVLGNRVLLNSESHSYAYHLSNTSDETEYLYEPWFIGYRKFINSARQEASKHKYGVVIRTDIKSYYPNIIQERLLEITDKEFNIRSERIRWLMGKLLNKKIPKHKLGHGLPQGLLASGFYANIYLNSVDKRFNSDNHWNVKYYRYVDDIILVVPNPADKDSVFSTLKNELKNLGLKLNEKTKTDIYEDVSQFIEEIKEDPRLEELSDYFDKVINPLWIMNEEYRLIFDDAYRNHDRWWSLIRRYRQCLRSINIYIPKTELSRRIYKYLFNSWRRDKDLKRDSELKLPLFPGALPDNYTLGGSDSFELVENWKIYFINSELAWLEEKNRLRSELINLFQESWRELQQITSRSYSRERELQRHIRFTVNRLSLLGFEEILEDLEEILCNKPSLLGESLHPILNLAGQGYSNAIRRLGEHYRNSKEETSEYMRSVILQAMRYLPDFNTDDWELLVESATVVNSVVEKLKATETWLFLRDVSKRFVKEHHINAVLKALNSDPPPQTRLQKNYVLILGRHKPEAIPEITTSENDYLLREALDIAEEEDISYLFEEEEPPVIRQYYSGHRPANMEEERPS